MIKGSFIDNFIKNFSYSISFTISNLLIPNRLIYEIPTTGGTVNNNIRNIGIVIAILGVIILLFSTDDTKNNYRGN